MSQLDQTPSDDTQKTPSNFSLPPKDYSPLPQSIPLQTSDSLPAGNGQAALSTRLSRLQQAKDDLISDLNALRKSRPTTNTSQNSRPFAVTVAAIATIVMGILYLLISLAFLILPAYFDLVNYVLTLDFSSLAYYGMRIPESFFIVMHLIIVVLQDLAIGAILYCSFMGIAHLYVARGLWQYKYGAYWGVMGLQGLAILVQFIILTLLHSGGFFLACTYIPLLIVAFATYGFHGALPFRDMRRELFRGHQKVSSVNANKVSREIS